MGVVVSDSRGRRPRAARILGITLAPRFRTSVGEVRGALADRDRALFDILCVAGHLGQTLPNSNANIRAVSGSRDLRSQLERASARVRGPNERAWLRSSARLVPVLVRELRKRQGEGDDRALHILLGSSSIALAPDCSVPGDPVLLVAWKTIVALFARLYSAGIKPLGRLAWLDGRHLAVLKRETAAGRVRGRLASGQRPGAAGRRLAVDARLMSLVGKALGLSASPGYEARYIFYTKDGDYFWPHPDDPEYAVNVLVCLDHQRPRRNVPGSALLAYRADGSVERYELTPGSALALEARGLVHAREPMRRGERMTILSIAVNAPPSRVRSRRLPVSRR